LPLMIRLRNPLKGPPPVIPFVLTRVSVIALYAEGSVHASFSGVVGSSATY